ncbi:MAG: universal stress protein [Myxococcaceae bacterium]
MDAIKKIVVGIDGSPQSTQAAMRALELGRQLKAVVKLVHALPPLIYPPEAMMVPTVDLDASRLEAANETVTQTLRGLREAAQGIEVTAEVVKGTAAEALVEIAERQGAQLIVVGSRGRGPISRLLLGSTADRVVHLARANVLVVR